MESQLQNKCSDFVAEYWHFDNITRKSEAQFIRSHCTWAKKKGYHASKAKAKIIYTLACNGIPTLPENGVVCAMNGVGDVLAPRLIAEIGDVRHFHSGSALIAFAGIDSPP